MYLNEILPGNWREDEWPEHIEVSHDIWALIAIARWLSGGPDGADAMTHFGIAFILANIFELRSEMGKIGEK